MNAWVISLKGSEGRPIDAGCLPMSSRLGRSRSVDGWLIWACWGRPAAAAVGTANLSSSRSSASYRSSPHQKPLRAPERSCACRAWDRHQAVSSCPVASPASNGMTHVRLQRRHLSSTASPTRRASKLPHAQRTSSCKQPPVAVREPSRALGGVLDTIIEFAVGSETAVMKGPRGGRVAVPRPEYLRSLDRHSGLSDNDCQKQLGGGGRF